MNSLRGIFPEPKIKYKRNFIKENIKHIKRMQVEGASAKNAENNNDNKKLQDIHKIKSEPQTNILQKNRTNKLSETKRSAGTVPKESDVTNRNIDEINFRSIGLQTDLLNLAKNTRKKTKTPPLKSNTHQMCAGDTATSSQTVEKTNAIENKSKSKEIAKKYDVTSKKSNDKDNVELKGYQRGVVPKYIRDRQKELAPLEVNDPECPPGHIAVPDAERKETLRALRQSYADLITELNLLPVKSDTLRTRNRKIELEKQLNKIEEGIKVFSRPKVYVKINA